MDEKIRYILQVKDDGTTQLLRFGNAAAGAAKKTKGASSALSDFAGEIPGVCGALSGFAKGPAAMAGVAVGAVAIGLAGAVKSAIDYADAMNDMSDRTGVAVETLSRLAPVAELGGTSLESVAGIMGKFAAKVAAGDAGIRSLRLSTTDAAGAMVEIANRVAAAKTQTEAIAIAQTAYGKQWQEMMPILKMGGEQIQSVMGGAAVVTADAARRAAEFNDKITVMKNKFAGVGLGIAEWVLPQLDKWLEGVDRIRKAFGLLSGDEERVAARNAIIEKYQKAWENRGRNALVWKSVGQVRLDGASLREALAAFDAANKAPTSPVAPTQPTIDPDAAARATAAAKSALQAEAEKNLAIEQARLKWNDDMAAKAAEQRARESETIAAEDAAALQQQKDAWNLAQKERYAITIAAEERILAQQEAMQQTYYSVVTGYAQQASSVLQSGFLAIGDGADEMFSTIGDGFKAMLAQMVAELAANAAIFGLLSLFSGGSASAFGGSLSGLSGLLLGHASGGTTPGGAPIIVGERRAEVIVPRGPSRVEQASGPTYNITVSNPAEARSTIRALKRDERMRRTGVA